ncbi:23S rRNA (uracil(1939)-C(5))-methyltransferase RlmD [Marinicrinis lubricantis]|uniref:23S rRNA (Uracil(1939)-C(5))-methyltransferase RlmD n=1 Tax=Marinicrinis lubricantis TaxID=2086470 RepID=A0ABW1IQB4_9BACL
MAKQAAKPEAERVQVGTRFKLDIRKIGINGEGIGYYKRKTVFVPGALPGETAEVEANRVFPNYIQGKLIRVTKKSKDRAVPPCPVYDQCGGCQLQHMSYEAQLRAKEEIVRESFARYTGLNELPMLPIFGMEDPWKYRNKAQMQVGHQKGKMITGLYAPGSHQLVDLSGCPIHHPAVNRVIAQVKQIAERFKIPVYQERKRTGTLRNIVVRCGFASEDLQLTLVTAGRDLPQKKELIAAVTREIPQVTSISQNINPHKTSLIFGDETLHLWGKETMEERLGELRYELSPRAFFQLNPEQTLKLYDEVKRAAALTGKEEVMDLYCGTGTIALWLAPHAKKVFGIEMIPEAIEDAKQNAKNNGITNAEFMVGKAEQLLPQRIQKGERPDVIVVDPPRTGCDDKLLKAVIQAKPKRFVYVSCNPSTLAKDCKVLLDNGFRIEWIRPVDMFPQTAHVECCSLFVRND